MKATHFLAVLSILVGTSSALLWSPTGVVSTASETQEAALFGVFSPLEPQPYTQGTYTALPPITTTPSLTISQVGYSDHTLTTSVTEQEISRSRSLA